MNRMNPHQLDRHLCRVCGLVQAEPPWGEDGKTPTLHICDCCGVEFGYEDATTEGVVRLRERWVSKGTCWFHKASRPAVWDLSAQLARIGYGQKS